MSALGESADLLKELGEITTVRPKMSESGLHNFGLIGPDKTPVITVPGDPVVAGIAAEIFVRPMIRKMLGAPNIFRNQLKFLMFQQELTLMHWVVWGPKELRLNFR